MSLPNEEEIMDMENKNIFQAKPLTEEEIDVYEQLLEMQEIDEKNKPFLDFIEPVSQLEILINCRWKFEHGKEFTDFERFVRSELLTYPLRAYAAETYYKSNQKFFEMASIPYPVNEITMEQLGELLKRATGDPLEGVEAGAR